GGRGGGGEHGGDGAQAVRARGPGGAACENRDGQSGRDGGRAALVHWLRVLAHGRPRSSGGDDGGRTGERRGVRRPGEAYESDDDVEHTRAPEGLRLLMPTYGE